MSNCAHFFHVSFRNEFSPTELYKKLQSMKEENQKLKDKIKELDTGIIAP